MTHARRIDKFLASFEDVMTLAHRYTSILEMTTNRYNSASKNAAPLYIISSPIKETQRNTTDIFQCSASPHIQVWSFNGIYLIIIKAPHSIPEQYLALTHFLKSGSSIKLALDQFALFNPNIKKHVIGCSIPPTTRSQMVYYFSIWDYPIYKGACCFVLHAVLWASRTMADPFAVLSMHKCRE